MRKARLIRMSDDWYRSTEWSLAARADFEARLQRSRSWNRPQYLRIKALALIGTEQTVEPMTLLQRILDEYPDSLDASSAMELIGDLRQQAGDLTGAERAYRDLIEARPDLNATTGQARISLGEVLLKQHGIEAVDEVRSLIRESDSELRFNSSIVRALVPNAQAAELVGDRELQVSEAKRALQLIDAPPQLSRKPEIGVPNPSPDEINEIKRLARP